MQPDDPVLHTPISGVSPLELIPEVLCNQLQIHALEAFPHEAVGYVRDGAYHRIENISPTPEVQAAFPTSLLAELMIEGIDVLFHSHPNGPHCPSAEDMRLQMDMDVPHALISTDGVVCAPIIVYGDGVERPPLLGRTFIHGHLDCFGVIQDFARSVQNIEFENFPRDWEWWTDYKEGEGGHYLENFSRWGYRETEGDLQVGDVFLLKAGSLVPNHAGIYIGDHLLLHHLGGREAYDPSRVSTVEPLIRWQQHGRIEKVLRHGGQGL